MKLSQLASIFNHAFRANVGNFTVKVPYVGLWGLKMSWKVMRGYLVDEDGVLTKLPDGTKPSDVLERIVLKHHILVIRTYAGTCGEEHNYAVYTASALRPSAPHITLVGWRPTPLGASVAFLHPNTLLFMTAPEVAAHELEHTRVSLLGE